MSLKSLRDLRMGGLRPAHVRLVTLDCPKPWPWLRDDPSIVWLPPRCDVRSHDLRPLVGLPVDALVDNLDRRVKQVQEAVENAGGVLCGVADGGAALVTDRHPWKAHEGTLGSAWRDGAAHLLVGEQIFFWSVYGGSLAG